MIKIVVAIVVCILFVICIRAVHAFALRRKMRVYDEWAIELQDLFNEQSSQKSDREDAITTACEFLSELDPLERKQVTKLLSPREMQLMSKACSDRGLDVS